MTHITKPKTELVDSVLQLRCECFDMFFSTAQILGVQSRMILTEPTPLASYRFLCVRYPLRVITFTQSDAVQISTLKEPRLNGTALLR